VERKTLTQSIGNISLPVAAGAGVVDGAAANHAHTTRLQLIRQ